MTMPTVNLACITPENIGAVRLPDGTCAALDAYIVTRTRYIGKVIAVNETEKCEPRGWDDNYVYRRIVTVWDGNSARVFETDYAIVPCGKNRASAWGVDATPDVMAAYYKWHLSVELPQQALLHGENEKGRYLRELCDGKEKLLATPNLAKGQTYKVVRGRKVPIGTTGKVFWFGDKGWGMSVGLATTDRRDARGHNLDVVFVALKNLEYVREPKEVMEIAAAVAANNTAMAEADAVKEKHATAWYKSQVEAWVKRTGYDGDSVRERLIEVLTDILKSQGNHRDDASVVALVALKTAA